MVGDFETNAMNTHKIWFCCLSIFAASGSLALGQTDGIRAFTSAEGNASILASVVSIQGSNVELKRSDGKTFLFPVDRLSVEDGLYLKDWSQRHAEATTGKDGATSSGAAKGRVPRVSIAVYTGKTSKSDDQIAGYIDEKKQKLSFGVELKNEDRDFPSVSAGGMLLVFGESIESGRSTVVYKEALPMTELVLYKSVRLDAKPFELWYDDKGAVYGFKYTGYVVVMKDANGALVAEKTIPGSASRYLENALKLEAGDEFNKNYEKVGQALPGDMQQAVRMR